MEGFSAAATVRLATTGRVRNEEKTTPGNLQLFVVQHEAQGDGGTAQETRENAPRARTGLEEKRENTKNQARHAQAHGPCLIACGRTVRVLIARTVMSIILGVHHLSFPWPVEDLNFPRQPS
ncbi:hypothetical protein Blon_1499 [Bifidobacterium longum subsp. infantis ATCC 15697 = JCM 1222 = DSM 20088]|uniref:Uncharacterized protein n=1 Tax=Bifidobacterium longum subsp. infantis (strain ATCC 15697 / DSM 20088 / JCM 1222 / NCTC 11817 / S12) TaxID=391904 RepID=B7GS00_BIFLS|nr:hypothetical protein Blon_1499 [Bifidobacterium longum subsp. infantis ATCC 15697 = JCM 1222 = DSM 20088]